jgi:hypothetical protein
MPGWPCLCWDFELIICNIYSIVDQLMVNTNIKPLPPLRQSTSTKTSQCPSASLSRTHLLATKSRMTRHLGETVKKYVQYRNGVPQPRGLQSTALSPVSHLTSVMYTSPLRAQSSHMKRLDATLFQNHIWLKRSRLILDTTLLTTHKTSLTTIPRHRVPSGTPIT